MKNREAHPHEEFPGVPAPPGFRAKVPNVVGLGPPSRESRSARNVREASDEVARLAPVTLKKLSRSVEKV